MSQYGLKQHVKEASHIVEQAYFMSEPNSRKQHVKEASHIL